MHVKVGRQKVTSHKEPFWSLMIIEAVRSRSVFTVICIVIMTTIRPIRSIQRLQSQRAKHQVSDLSQCFQRMCGLKELRRHDHRHPSIAAKLIVTKGLTGMECILVNATSMNQTWLEAVILIVFLICIKKKKKPLR